MRRQPLFELSTLDPGLSDSRNPGFGGPPAPKPRRGDPITKCLLTLCGICAAAAPRTSQDGHFPLAALEGRPP
jgi:hypothetical protein